MKHTQDDAGDLLTTLRILYPTSSTTTLRKMLTQGRVLVNDTVVHRAKHVLEKGDEIEVLQRQRAEERTPSPASKPPVELDVLFEDDTLLVVNKPHQLLSVATDRLEPIPSTAVAWNTSSGRMKKHGATSFIDLTKQPQASWSWPSPNRQKTTSKNNSKTEPFTAPIGQWLKDARTQFRGRYEVG